MAGRDLFAARPAAKGRDLFATSAAPVAKPGTREYADWARGEVMAGRSVPQVSPTPPEATLPSNNPIADMVGGLNNGGGLSRTEEASGDWERNVLLPRANNKVTGEQRWAVPGLVQGSYDALIDAVKLPGDTLAGKYDDQLDPRVSKSEVSPELIGRGLNFGAMAAPMANVPRTAAAVDLAANAARQQADEFAIPLTKGQTSQDIKQLTREEILRQTDNPAQPIIRGFDDQQREAIGTARDQLGREIGGNAEDLGPAVTQGIKDRVAFSQEQAGSLYRIAEDGNLVIHSGAVKALPAFVKERVVASPIIMDPTVTPTAVAAYKLIEEAGLNAGELNTSLKGIEQIRKRLVGLSGVSQEDKAATRTVKQAFDEWLDDSVDKALFSGDETSIDALKAARAESRYYLGITNPKSGDAAGAAVKRMQEGDATAEQVANWLYGADIVSPNLNAPSVAGRVKTLLGPMSPEWSAVRASAWRRLVDDLGTGDLRSATMMAKRLDNFLNNKGSSLSKVLFSDAERSRMRAFSEVLKRTVTPRDATNPSRSAFMLNNLMGGILTTLLGAAGYSAAGVGGLVAAAAVPVFRNARKIGFAKAAVAGPNAAKSGLGITQQAPNLAARALAFNGEGSLSMLSGGDPRLQASTTQ